MGFLLHEPSIIMLVASFLLSCIPILFHSGFRSISSFIAITIYLLLYIPTILTFALGLNAPTEKVIFIQFIFFVSMCLLFLADRVRCFHFKIAPVKFISFRIFLVLTIVFSLYVVYIYSGNLRFVSFEEVYIQRASTQDIGSSMVARYMQAWLKTILVPLCLIYGLFNKKLSYFIAGSLSCIILYMATASKSIILVPFLYVGLYYFLIKINLKNLYIAFAVLLSLIMLIFLLIASNELKKTHLSMASSIILMRVVGVGGLSNLLYYDFFEEHPKTYYSHIRPVNALTDSYPYDESLGETIGFYNYNKVVNANANFWATDGVASVGIVGVFIISVVLSFFFILLNSVTNKYNKKILIFAYIPFIGVLLNASLFQAIYSGGGLFMTLILLFLKPRHDWLHEKIDL